MKLRDCRPVIQRFLEKVAVNPETGCWEWTGGIRPNGYGQFSAGRKEDGTASAHRVSYELFVGPIPPRLELDHLCRVRHCVNPKHLEPVTARENTRRSMSPHGINARKTHCKNNHLFDDGNTRIRPNGARVCRRCERERMREIRATRPRPSRARAA